MRIKKMMNMMMKKKLKISLMRMIKLAQKIKMKLNNMKIAKRRNKNSTRIKITRFKNNSILIKIKKQIIIKLFLTPQPQMKNEIQINQIYSLILKE
jgi:hypothetical protein